MSDEPTPLFTRLWIGAVWLASIGSGVALVYWIAHTLVNLAF